VSGLRDRRKSDVRTRGMRSHGTDDGHVIARQLGARIRALYALARTKVSGMELPSFDGQVDDHGAEQEHFAETMLGGVAITLGILTGIILLMWISSLF